MIERTSFTASNLEMRTYVIYSDPGNRDAVGRTTHRTSLENKNNEQFIVECNSLSIIDLSSYLFSKSFFSKLIQ